MLLLLLLLLLGMWVCPRSRIVKRRWTKKKDVMLSWRMRRKRRR